MAERQHGNEREHYRFRKLASTGEGMLVQRSNVWRGKWPQIPADAIWILVVLAWILPFSMHRPLRLGDEESKSPYHTTCAVCGKAATGTRAYFSQRDKRDVGVYLCIEHMESPPPTLPERHFSGSGWQLDVVLAFCFLAILIIGSYVDRYSTTPAQKVKSGSISLLLSIYLVFRVFG